MNATDQLAIRPAAAEQRVHQPPPPLTQQLQPDDRDGEIIACKKGVCLIQHNDVDHPEEIRIY